jgi:hypothetical protein
MACTYQLRVRIARAVTLHLAAVCVLLSSTFGACASINSAAAYYTAPDGFRHTTVQTTDDALHEIYFFRQRNPTYSQRRQHRPLPAPELLRPCRPGHSPFKETRLATISRELLP